MWAGTRKVKPIWILLKQETVSGSGISWDICKCAPRSRQITTPAPHHSVFYRPDALPAAQPTASKHCRQLDYTRKRQFADYQLVIPLKQFQFYWLDGPDRVLFKLAVTVHQCLNGRTLPYLSEHCIPVSSADTRRHLRSTNRHLLTVPRFRLNT